MNTTLFDLFDCTVSAGGPPRGTKLAVAADIPESPTKKRSHSDPLGTAQPQEPQDTVIDFEDMSEEALEEWCAALEGMFPSPSKSCRSVKSTQSVNNWEEQTLPPRPAASE